MVRTDFEFRRVAARRPTEPIESCRHDRAPLRRLGIITHERTGRRVYVLLCTECGFTVTTDELRRLRGRPPAAAGEAPGWLPPGS